ncbi:MAG TPA: GntR family transcriptional regulator [Ktedonosporobacter sp.]|nr:GntR family transcriptional regulator [Ktedonosporobacter sp.]
MTLKLDKKENARALHLQLMTYFRERILDGRFPPGTRLPTELELAQEHQISRDTVRQALALLVSEGLLERVQGRGTFVRRPPQAHSDEAKKDKKHIGLVLNRPPTAQLNMDILIGVEQAAKSHGYHVTFTYAEESQEQETRDIARLRTDQVMGLIIFPRSDSAYDEAIWQLHADHIPFVLIDRYFPDLAADYVGPDNVGGGYRATEHLLILGHERIGFVSSPIETLQQTTSVHDRWEGYRSALEKYGISYDETLVIPKTTIAQADAQAVYTEFLLQPDHPTAIFAGNDLVALDLLHIARRHGIRIPEDLALVGFDDLSFAAHLTPPLTTVAQPLMDVGLRAGNLLISRIEGQITPPKRIELPTSLIVRESCGARLRVKRSSSLDELR